MKSGILYRIFWLIIDVLAISAFSIPGYAQWQATGPYGGPAEIIRVDSADPATVLAATRNGLLYRSADHGKTWVHLPFPAQLLGVLHVIEMDARRPGVWYAGIEGDQPWNSGVYRTTDGGTSWTFLPDIRGQAVWSLAIWQADSKVIAAGTAEGVYLSRDAGDTWQRISPESNNELRPVVSITFDPTSSDLLYAGTTHLPWRTTNGGGSWKSIHSGMLDDSDVFSIHVDPGQPQIVYASACSGAYRSTSRGDQWRRLATPRGAFRTYLVTLDPNKPDMVYAATSSGLLKSSNSGLTFRKVSSHAIKSIAFDLSRSGRIYFASTTGGLLLSTDDGETLQENNQGFANRTLTSLSGSGRVLYVSTAYEPDTGGLFRSDDLGVTWRPTAKAPLAGGGNIRLAAATLRDPNVLFAAPSRGLLTSSTGGRTWSAVNLPPGDQHIAALLTLPGKPESLLTGTVSGLFRSVNHGITWTSVLPKESVVLPRVRLLQASSDSNIAAVTDAGAFLSPDGGTSWTSCTQPLPGIQWYGLAFDSTSGGIALAATSHGLFRSSDSCRSWKIVDSGLDAGTVSIVIAHPSHRGEFFAAQRGRIWHSVDAGEQWQDLNDEGRAGSYPSVLLILPGLQDRLFALVARRGVLYTQSHEQNQNPRTGDGQH